MVQVHAKMAMVHWCNNDWRSYLAGLNSSAQLILAQSDGVMVGLMAGLTMGLKATGGCSNGQRLGSAGFCLLMATDGSDNGGCREGSSSTDGSRNGSTDYVCGVAHNTLHTLEILPTFPACKSAADFSGSWTKIKQPVPTYNSLGDEILRKYPLQNFDFCTQRNMSTYQNAFRDNICVAKRTLLIWDMCIETQTLDMRSKTHI